MQIQNLDLFLDAPARENRPFQAKVSETHFAAKALTLCDCSLDPCVD